MRNLKKIICVFMILSLCLGLCGCGAVETSDERIKARLKGSGSSKLKLTLFVEPPEGFAWTAVQPETEDGVPFSVVQKSSKSGTDRYEIKANREGTFTLKISYRNDAGEIYAEASMLLMADAKHKITCQTVLVSGRDDYKKYEDENLSGEDFEISNYESGAVRDIKLVSRDGVWQIGSYDAAVILPEDTGMEGEYSTFRVAGLKLGVSDLVLFNKNAKLQVIISMAVTEDDLAPEGETAYLLTVTGTKSEPYDESEEAEYIQEKQDALALLQAFAGDSVIPGDAKFSSAMLYAFKNPDGGVDSAEYAALRAKLAAASGEEEKAAAQKELDSFFAKKDSLDLKLEYQDVRMFCTVTKAKGLEQYVTDFTKGMSISSEESVSLGELNVRCMVTTDGFGMAFFEKDGFVWSLLAANSFTKDSFTQFMTEYVKSAD